VHHLYLWYLADKMGVLSNVLNMLNAEAGADTDNVHTDAQRVQKCRRNGDDKEEKAEQRAFRLAVGGSLHTLATTMAITSKEESLRKEEDKLERFQLAYMEAEACADTKKMEYYGQLIECHGRKVKVFISEINGLKKIANSAPTADGN
jgi:5'-deoxynucleotidase YfbR-like HD superfamily hydrolase